MDLAVQTPLKMVDGEAINAPANDGQVGGIPQIFPRQRRFSRELLTAIGHCFRLVDCLAVYASGYLAYSALRSGISEDLFLVHARDMTAGALLALLLISHAELYRERALSAAPGALKAIGLAGLAEAAILCLGFIQAPPHEISCLWGALWLAFTALLLGTPRLTLALKLHRMMQQGAIRDAVAIVGANPVAHRIVDHFMASASLKADNAASVEVVGIFDDRHSRLPPDTRAPTGSIDDLLALGKTGAFDRVIIAIPSTAERRVGDLCDKLKALSIDVALCPDGVIFDVPPRSRMTIGTLSVVALAQRPLRTWQAAVKRAEDLVLASLALLFFGPLMLAIGIVVKLDSRGPALFRQRRHGFNNVEIDVYKFRTMRTELTDTAGSRQASRDDPRVTRIGRILRRCSLDELPQLLNVLKGEMSLVGPRPHPIGMKTGDLLCHEIVQSYAHRHRMKPGITGWAQVNGLRGATATPEQLLRRVEHDLFYVEHWSLLFDLKIILKTLRCLFVAENAF